jgi:hypothetical protein
MAVHDANQSFSIGGLLRIPHPRLFCKLLAPSKGTKNSGPALFTDFRGKCDGAKGRGLNRHHNLKAMTLDK